LEIKIGENIRFLRNKYKYTLEDVADIIGVSRQSVSKWEKGETYPDIENCLKLSLLFKTTIDSLVKSFEGQTAQADREHRYVCETVVVGTDGEIKLPQKARELFGVNAGDIMIVLCDSTQGMALVKAVEENYAQHN